MELTQSLLHELIDYNPSTGLFVWKSRCRRWFNCNRSWNRWNNMHEGKEAGGPTSDGYLRINLLNKKYKSHRLAFLYVYGYMPKNTDHEDHDGTNNRISNLKDVTHKQNLRNMRMKKSNTSGTTGVYWRKDTKKWAAQIMVDGKCIALGSFDTKTAAKVARKAANTKYGFHRNHGKAA